MGEQESTASTIISFAQNLEEQSLKFYEELAQKFAEYRETFLSFIKESKTNKVSIMRSYQETVTDAFETGFSFKGLNLSEYAVDPKILKNNDIADALEKAIELEDKTSRYYSVVAQKSKGLLATISTDFARISEKRRKRKPILESLLAKISACRLIK